MCVSILSKQFFSSVLSCMLLMKVNSVNQYGCINKVLIEIILDRRQRNDNDRILINIYLYLEEKTHSRLKKIREVKYSFGHFLKKEESFLIILVGHDCLVEFTELLLVISVASRRRQYESCNAARSIQTVM